jgi:hypothetical protein
MQQQQQQQQQRSALPGNARQLGEKQEATHTSDSLSRDAADEDQLLITEYGVSAKAGGAAHAGVLRRQSSRTARCE